MVAATRARRREQLSRVLETLHDDLWIEVLSHLSGKDLGRVACVSNQFRAINDAVWQQACARRWPSWTQTARASDTQWRRQYELLELRELELQAVVDVSAISKLQEKVNTKHRTILTEWLAEVSWDWRLDSIIVFKAVSYLDHYMSTHKIQELERYQLVGIACLRAAMKHNQIKLPAKAPVIEGTPVKDALDPARFVYISDKTYTVDEVEKQTAIIEREIPQHVRAAPNAKMFLRSYWYRACSTCHLNCEEMHLYTVASFYLQLGLLQLECSAFTASCMAASALSNALEMFGKPAWSLALQHYSAYTQQDLYACKQVQKETQRTVAADHLRTIWRGYHEGHGYEHYQSEWDRAIWLISCAGRVP